jgi:prevent-host-death family protein
MSYMQDRRPMKAVSAHYASERFSELLSQVESGQEVIITRRGHPVAVLSPYRAPTMRRERRAAIKRALAMMAKGLPWGHALWTYTRDEMHER